MTCDHTCKPTKDQKSSFVKVSTSKSDIKVEEVSEDTVIKMIKDEPLKSQSYFFAKCISQGVKVSKTKIKRLVKDVREELFPADPNFALSDEFCKTRGDSTPQQFVQYKGEIRIPLNNKGNGALQDQKKEFIIFGSRFMLKLLEDNSWFIDATFSIVPTSYYQLLTTLVYSQVARTYVPALYALCQSKQEIAYIALFNALKVVCEGYGLKLNPIHIMCDFEAALRNALSKVWNNAKLNGCFFHFCQCLWRWAGAHGLRSSESIPLAKKVITVMKILPHMEKEERKIIFKELQDSLKNKGKVYKDFLFYYQRYWLESYSIDDSDLEGNNRIVRTNNVCEQYHRRLVQKVGIKHPRLAILVSHLIDEECLFKKKVIGSLSQESYEIFTDHCSVSKEEALPFSEYIALIKEQKKQKYNFRYLFNETILMKKLEEICLKCEEFLFPNLKSQALYDKEQETAGIWKF